MAVQLQQQYTYRHNQVLSVLASALVEVFANAPYIKVYTDLPNFYADNAPQTTIPTNLPITSYHPDIVIHNSQSPSITLFELTCPLDSSAHIQAAQSRKQNKVEYLQLLAKFNCLNIANYYDTIEISVLGHYQLSSIKDLLNLSNFVHPELNTSKGFIKKCLDDAASATAAA